MSQAIQLIVGLGNPGPDYDSTRHNAGAWFVERLADVEGESLRPEKKFLGLVTQIDLNGNACRLLLPTTFMNHSGQSVRAICDFYKIKPEAILVAHDELDLPAGAIKLKRGGGHGGHNGLRDIISHLGTQQFLRLRVGIGHPGHKDRVHDYVLGRPSRADDDKIRQCIEDAITVTPSLLAGDIDRATRNLHSS